VHVIAIVLPSAYFACALLNGMAFAGERAPRVARGRQLLTVATIGLHVLMFVLHALAIGTFPVQGAWLTLSSVALTVALLFDVVTLHAPQPTVGTIVLALVGVLQLGAAALVPFEGAAARAPQDAIAVVHILLMLSATAALVLSGTYGLLHLVLYRQLRNKRFGALFQELPDLELLSRMTRRSALAGCLCLTVGLNVGIGLAHARDVAAFHYTDPSVVIVIALWLHFGVIAFSRSIRGLTARRASYAAVGGLITMLLAIVLMVLPGLTFHALS
jgi:ABC-type uncharacterized transport system permease subunit